jgi:predicted TPR repeat methyltransferase
VTLGDGDAAGGVTSHDPPHQLIVGRIEETEFDRYAEPFDGRLITRLVY